jgi:hypothetical protein
MACRALASDESLLANACQGLRFLASDAMAYGASAIDEFMVHRLLEEAPPFGRRIATPCRVIMEILKSR